MTFEEFLEKAREADGWKLHQASTRVWIRNAKMQCPLAAVFGEDYRRKGREANLSIYVIMDAADGNTNGKYRKALLGLVKP